MDFAKLQNLYVEYHEGYKSEEPRINEAWRSQSQRFREFWQDKIMNDERGPLSKEDLIPAIQILDTHGKRDTEEDHKVLGIASTLIAQNDWYNVFEDIRSDKELRSALDALLKSRNSQEQANLIDRVYSINKKRNSLTGGRAVMINCFLFAYSPGDNLAIVSLNDRQLLMKYLGIDSSELEGKSIGQRDMETRQKLLEFRDKIATGISSWEYSKFLYSDALRSEWKKEPVNWWVEVTSSTDHQDSSITVFDTHYGQSLHSPQKDKSGGDSYRRMREIKAGDRIIHFDLDTSKLTGVSVVKERFQSLGEEKYYVNLQDYQPFNPPIDWERLRVAKDKGLREALEEGGSSFYAEFHPDRSKPETELRINQKYLCKAPVPVLEIVDEYYFDASGNHIPHYTEDAQVVQATTTALPVPPDYPRNIILYGPVGTGKTYIARKIAYKLAKNDLAGLPELLKGNDVDIPDFAVEFKQLQGTRIFFLTFHKSYSYEQFVIGITAKTNAPNQIEYSVEDGVFKQICGLAERDIANNYVLIIDEINRGDISKIFGELITLLEEDKRIGASSEIRVKLPYRKPDGSTENFGVPLNLYVIGTMNTTDRSIALLDVALRRRFRTFEIGPNYDFIRQSITDANVRDVVLKSLISINNRISAYKGPDFTIGHVYFRNLGPNPKKGIRDAWYNQILPLLMEYFYDDYKTLKEKILNRTNFVNPLDNKDKVGKETQPMTIVNKDYQDDAKLDEFYQEFAKIAATPEA